MIAVPRKTGLDRSGDPARIALVCTQRGWSGGEAQAQLLAWGLVERGLSVSIMARQGSEFAQRFRDEGFAVDEFLGRGRNPWGAWQLRQHLLRRQPDIVHLNDPHALTSFGIATLGQQRPLSVVARRVDFAIKSPRRYRRLCQRVLCVSRAVFEVCQAAGLPRSMLRVVTDGIDPLPVAAGDGVAGRQSLQLHAEVPLLLSVARLSDHKGHSYLLDAMPLVLREFPDAVLCLAGDGELRGDLEQQALRLALGASVRFLGHRNDIPDLLQAADLFVMASHSEGLGSSVIEAMCAGLPVVATAAGGIPDLLGHRPKDSGAVGWIVPPRDPLALAHAIRFALSQPQLCYEVAEHARQRALKYFTVEGMVEATVQVYEELLSAAMPGQRLIRSADDITERDSAQLPAVRAGVDRMASDGARSWMHRKSQY